MGLSSAEIAAMQATLTASLPETMQILRNSPTSDGQGGQTDHRAPLAPIQARREDLEPADEAVIGGTLEGVTGYAVVLPAATDIRQSDQLKCTSDNLVLEVLGFHATGAWELCRRVVCRTVGGS